MKKMLILCLALALSLTAACAEEVLAITPEETLARMEENAYLNLIDVRDEEAYDAGHLPKAALFPLESLEKDMQDILDSGFSNMDAEIIVYADTEENSRAACETLGKLGFANVHSMGAIKEWPYEVLTTEQDTEQQALLMAGFITTDLYGATVDQSLLSDKKLTMVNVWATFCNPCIKEMPELAKLNADYAEKGVQIIGLVSDATDRDMKPIESKVKLAKEIAEATGAGYPHLLPSLEMEQKILVNVAAVPTTFFVDEQGKLVGKMYMGSRDYAAWSQIIDETLALLP